MKKSCNSAENPSGFKVKKQKSKMNTGDVNSMNPFTTPTSPLNQDIIATSCFEGQSRDAAKAVEETGAKDPLSQTQKFRAKRSLTKPIDRGFSYVQEDPVKNLQGGYGISEMTPGGSKVVRINRQ